MNTNEFIRLLAQQAEPVFPKLIRQRLVIALGWGLSGTLLVMAVALGVRPDLGAALSSPVSWMKLALPVSMAVLAYGATVRLASPGGRLGRIPSTLALLLAVSWTYAAAVLLNAGPAARHLLVFGDNWLFCLLSVPLLSLPVLVGVLWAAKKSAPSRLSLAGGAAGLLAGAVGAAVYSLHCTEMGAPFIAIWYVLGMGISAVAGAAIGRQLLRW